MQLDEMARWSTIKMVLWSVDGKVYTLLIPI